MISFFTNTTAISFGPRKQFIRLIMFVKENNIGWTESTLKQIGQNLELPALEIEEVIHSDYSHILPKVDKRENNIFCLNQVVYHELAPFGDFDFIPTNLYRSFINYANGLGLGVSGVDHAIKLYCKARKRHHRHK
jgi:hypothetical protein